MAVRRAGDYVGAANPAATSSIAYRYGTHHARPRLPLAQQSGQGSPVAHEEERHTNISEADLLREEDCVSSSSSGSSSSSSRSSSSNSNNRTTQ